MNLSRAEPSQVELANISVPYKHCHPPHQIHTYHTWPTTLHFCNSLFQMQMECWIELQQPVAGWLWLTYGLTPTTASGSAVVTHRVVLRAFHARFLHPQQVKTILDSPKTAFKTFTTNWSLQTSLLLESCTMITSYYPPEHAGFRQKKHKLYSYWPIIKQSLHNWAEFICETFNCSQNL